MKTMPPTDLHHEGVVYEKGCRNYEVVDLTPDNTPPGTRLAIGNAVIEITDTPHKGCGSFIERYGRDACIFVNTGEGRRLRLRGIYGRVVRDGWVTVGDRVSKVDWPDHERLAPGAGPS